MQKHKIVIIGGGAAGFFAAINAAEQAQAQGANLEIQILESSDSVLKKVKISGGGRCNVTHNIFEVRQFCQNYPRGSKELLSAMQRFQARDTVEWFLRRGVNIVAEVDGRMFPDTNSSQTIIDCFQNSAREAGVKVLMNHSASKITQAATGTFRIEIAGQAAIDADSVLIATGSSQHGYRFAKELGHTITDLAPSLFSFKISDPLLAEIPGLSFAKSKIKLTLAGEVKFEEKGPLLITHWGLSGPAVLKISAWAAREMMRAHYQGQLFVNWLGESRIEDVVQLLKSIKGANLTAQMISAYPEPLARRFWAKILAKCSIREEKRWADLSNKEIQSLSEALFKTEFQVVGKNRFKDEFVECGGVSLKEIDFKTMQSKICPGLYFAGEVLDIDGITGGFNFQNAWTGGWIAAQNMVRAALTS